MTAFPGNPATALVRAIKDHGKRLKVAEQRVVTLESKMAKTETTLGTLTAAQVTALAKLSPDQLTALSTMSASVLNDISAIFAAQWVALAGLSSAQLNFLGGLSLLSHQSDTNSSLTGVENYCNNLTDNLISNGYMHS